MSDQLPGLDRFAALSDGIFAVIITIMVLDLRPPEDHDLQALLHMWPEVTSYTVSYLFIAVVWLNHHHVFGYATKLTNVLAFSNFATCSRSR
ncbi:TMEM175 family protein [Mycolicibacterium grossiae]|uniref:TMEM175 family protein n=1 Tax=Mycolicibacterium grossiae TaxID=1552759 RepID=UPI001B86B896|nr:TMEM175 family protein [Mycolicibacterium grossiae]